MFKKFNKNPRKFAKIMSFSFILAASTVVSGCIKNTDLVGYTFKSEKLDEIKLGQTTQDGVRKILGSPSVTSAYGDNSWYYISAEYTRVAFLSPEIKEQKIFAVTFDEGDVVREIKEYSESDAKDIKITREVTRSGGSDMGVIGQLLGNVGRFNSEPGKTKISKPRSVPR